jgi:hypothetical protein
VPPNARKLKTQRVTEKILTQPATRQALYRIESAPGFDKNHWPDTADAKWGAERQASAASAESGEPAKQYSRDLKKFAESGQVEPKAREAERGLDSAEGDDLKRAEQIGKRRSNIEHHER